MIGMAYQDCLVILCFLISLYTCARDRSDIKKNIGIRIARLGYEVESVLYGRAVRNYSAPFQDPRSALGCTVDTIVIVKDAFQGKDHLHRGKGASEYNPMPRFQRPFPLRRGFHTPS